MGYIGKTPTPAPLTASDITDGIITTDKLASNAVTSAKITDGTIATTDIADSAVTSVKTSGITSDMFRNLIINGDMSQSQRGNSTSGVTTTDGYYACDRWYTQTDTGTWTISQSTDVPSGQGFAKSLKLDCTSAGTSNADEVGIRYKHEGINVQHLKYGTSSAESTTVSFWIKTNKTGTYSLAMKNENNSQNRIASFNYTVSSADTWEKKTITFPGDTSRAIEFTSDEELTLYWWFSAASGFTSGGVQNTWTNYSASYFADSNLAGLGGSTSDEVYITGVQMEIGTTASDFEFLPFDINLRRCQRYLEICEGGKQFYNATSHQPRVNVDFKVQKRNTPTLINISTAENCANQIQYSVGSIDDTLCARVAAVNAFVTGEKFFYGKFKADSEM